MSFLGRVASYFRGSSKPLANDGDSGDESSKLVRDEMAVESFERDVLDISLEVQPDLRIEKDVSESCLQKLQANSGDLDKKIAKAKRHIERLELSSISCRRGKAGRAKHVSLQVQIEAHQACLDPLVFQAIQIDQSARRVLELTSRIAEMERLQRESEVSQI